HGVAVGHADPVAAARQHAHEMHETLAAHLFKALEFGKGISVVVDAHIEIRPFLVAANHERRRLLSSLVAASCLARVHRGDQPARKGERGIAFIRCGRVFDDPGAGEHVAGNREIVAGEMPAPVYAGFSGVRGDAVLRVHHMYLSVVASRVSGRYRGHDLRRGRALFQQSPTFGTEKGIDQRLSRDRTDARFDARNERARSEETTRNGNSELSGVLIAGNDRPGHASHPPVRRSKGSNWARCSAVHVTHALWVATSVYRISLLLSHEPVAVCLERGDRLVAFLAPLFA